eukprot:4217932-Prymnesium_polylepis.2
MGVVARGYLTHGRYDASRSESRHVVLPSKCSDRFLLQVQKLYTTERSEVSGFACVLCLPNRGLARVSVHVQREHAHFWNRPPSVCHACRLSACVGVNGLLEYGTWTPLCVCYVKAGRHACGTRKRRERGPTHKHTKPVPARLAGPSCRGPRDGRRRRRAPRAPRLCGWVFGTRAHP